MCQPGSLHEMDTAPQCLLGGGFDCARRSMGRAAFMYPLPAQSLHHLPLCSQVSAPLPPQHSPAWQRTGSYGSFSSQFSLTYTSWVSYSDNFYLTNSACQNIPYSLLLVYPSMVPAWGLRAMGNQPAPGLEQQAAPSGVFISLIELPFPVKSRAVQRLSRKEGILAGLGCVGAKREEGAADVAARKMFKVN